MYMIMTATLGVPPKPNRKFVWEYLDSDGKAGRWEGSPKQFYEEFGSKPHSVWRSFPLVYSSLTSRLAIRIILTH
jgi:bleomycin hydrolase